LSQCCKASDFTYAVFHNPNVSSRIALRNDCASPPNRSNRGCSATLSQHLPAASITASPRRWTCNSRRPAPEGELRLRCGGRRFRLGDHTCIEEGGQGSLVADYIQRRVEIDYALKRPLSQQTTVSEESSMRDVATRHRSDPGVEHWTNEHPRGCSEAALNALHVKHREASMPSMSGTCFRWITFRTLCALLATAWG
jgi:hypothetical protein